MRVIPAARPDPEDRSDWFDNLVVDGRKITFGDLWGYHRPDPVLGYAPLEATVSANGWWQSNNLGARRSADSPYPRTSGKSRALVYGDSFTNSSRVPQLETWPHVLEELAGDLEVINFGVDGYSLAQSFLRYRLTRDDLEHDLVAFVWVPTVDLWRDINVLRTLKEPWGDSIVMPRFVVEAGELQVVEPLYGSEAELYARNPGRAGVELLDHLRRYDRFYFEGLYEPGFLARHLFIGKLIATATTTLERKWLLRNLRSPGSEAMQVVTAILRRADLEAAERGSRLVWVILPDRGEVRELRQSRGFRREWRGLVAHLCRQVPHCIDLAPDLLAVEFEELDFGFDGTHYGPQANRRIAEALARHLEDQGLRP